MTCPDGMTYKKVCGACQRNCFNEKEDPMCRDEISNCILGCYCDDGLLSYQPGWCVTPEECTNLTSCQVPGRNALLPVSIYITRPYKCMHMYVCHYKEHSTQSIDCKLQNCFHLYNNFLISSFS